MVNDRVEKSRSEINELPSKLRANNIEHNITPIVGDFIELFDEKK